MFCSLGARSEKSTIQEIGSHAQSYTKDRKNTEGFCDGRAKFRDKVAQPSDNLLGQKQRGESTMKNEKVKGLGQDFVRAHFFAQG
jgi:hypothetical protein